jgi:hypothetical protein
MLMVVIFMMGLRNYKNIYYEIITKKFNILKYIIKIKKCH